MTQKNQPLLGLLISCGLINWVPAYAGMTAVVDEEAFHRLVVTMLIVEEFFKTAYSGFPPTPRLCRGLLIYRRCHIIHIDLIFLKRKTSLHRIVCDSRQIDQFHPGVFQTARQFRRTQKSVPIVHAVRNPF